MDTNHDWQKEILERRKKVKQLEGRWLNGERYDHCGPSIGKAIVWILMIHFELLQGLRRIRKNKDELMAILGCSIFVIAINAFSAAVLGIVIWVLRVLLPG